MLKQLIEREDRTAAWMQSRLLDLLLRHDQALFDNYFNERKGLASARPELQRYRDLAVLLRLRDELFEYIVPQIVRRLSFDAPRSSELEEHPVTGQIDWERTLSASWESLPNQPPLQLHTRQNRRNFATPENLLTVVTVLEYKATIERLLRSDDPLLQAQQLRSQLMTIVEQCERELSFPQFAGLREQAQAMLDQYQDPELIERLELTVSEHLLPGANNAYHELVLWREKLRTLKIGQLYSFGHDLTLALDLEQGSRIYQLWVLYELLEFLSLEGSLIERTDNQAEDQSSLLRFRWGEPESRCEYELLFNARIPSQWQGDLQAQPTFLLRRCDRQELRDGDQVIWHEPGYLLDAVYQRAGGPEQLLDQARKRLIGELHLSGEQRAIVLLPFVPQSDAQLTQPSSQQTRFSDRDGALQIELRQLAPLAAEENAVATQDPSLQQALRGLLDQLHQALQQRVALECHGTIADVDSINPHARAVPRCPRCQSVMAFCPKPHISRTKVDLVCPKCDCLSNRRLCHIIDLQTVGLPPRVERVLTEQELHNNIEQLRSWLRKTIHEDDDSERAEQLRKQVLEAIGEQTTSFMKYLQPNLRQIEDKFSGWVLPEVWQGVPKALHEQSRHMLMAGEYIWLEVEDSELKEWAACAVQFIRALEFEMKRRIYYPCKGRLRHYGKIMEDHQFTYGSVGAIERKRDANWQIILRYIAEPNSLEENQVATLFQAIERLRKSRNKVAHTDFVDKALAETIRNTVLGTPQQPGLLYRLASTLVPAQEHA